MRKRNDLKFYDESAAGWWDKRSKIFALSHLNPARFQYFDRHVASWSGLSVLDVGCGGGFTCEFLAERGARVSGVDQSQLCIAAAQEHGVGMAIDYRHGVGESLPYGDGTFDVVTCVDVLEHVVDVEQTLREIYRVLKPGGRFCFDTINRTLKSKAIMIWLLEDLLGEIPRGIHDWEKFIVPEVLQGQMGAVGFGSSEVKGFNIFGVSLFDNWRAYWHYRRTGEFQIKINEDLAVMYIGVAIKG